MVVGIYMYYEISVNTEGVCMGKGKKEQWSGAELCLKKRFMSSYIDLWNCRALLSFH